MTSLTLHRVDLDPNLIETNMYSSRRRRRHLLDIVALLNLMLVLLFLLPEKLVAPQLTAVGRPAALVGLLLTVTWALAKLHPRMAMRGPQPMRWIAVAYFVTYLMSYAAGYLRGLVPMEAGSADRDAIATAIFIGVVLVCADNIPNRSRLDDVLQVLVWCAGGMATIGLLQAVNIDLVPHLTIPGLQLTADLTGVEARGAGFFRVASTTTHYIEFSTVMVMCAPFAVHVARFGRTRMVRHAAIVAGLCIGAAIPATLSRTGIVGLAVLLMALLPAWPWRMRLNILAAVIGMIGAMAVLRPGLMGTIVSLFSNLGGDPSIQGRTDDYDYVNRFIAERPWFGRGPGTFIPELYQILDNQWLQIMLGRGVVGVIALVVLHVGAMVVAGVAYRRATTDADRHLCACLIAIQLVAMAAGGTFDSFAFTTFFFLLAVTIGLPGAMWRLTHPARLIRTANPQLTNI